MPLNLVVRRFVTRALPPRARRMLLKGEDGLVRARNALKDTRFAELLPLAPVSNRWGYERGQPIDRFYIERFLSGHYAGVRGHVLEFGSDYYTLQFGGDRVTKSDVLDVVAGNPKTTIVADLADAAHLPAEQFDCIICTQTLQMIFDLRPAVAQLHRLLSPGGTLYVTGSGTSKVGVFVGVDSWGEYWRFTTQSFRKLLEEVFPAPAVNIEGYGNVLTASAFLYGLAVEDLAAEALTHRDPGFDVIVAGWAQKAPQS